MLNAQLVVPATLCASALTLLARTTYRTTELTYNEDGTAFEVDITPSAGKIAMTALVSFVFVYGALYLAGVGGAAGGAGDGLSSEMLNNIRLGEPDF